MNEDQKPLSSLKAADYNPRAISQHDELALTNSIEAFGDLSSIVENSTTGNLVGGHQRTKVLLKRPEAHVRITQKFPQPDSLGTTALGYVEVDGTDIRLPYRQVAWDLEFEQAANIAANRIQGEFLMPELAKITEKLKNFNEDLLRLTGQREDEIAQLLDQFGSKQETNEEGDVPPLANDAISLSKPGTIYQLGVHRLMCGDAASELDVDKLMNGRRAGMVFTDPPYNVGYVGGGGQSREGIKNDKMSSTEFMAMLQAWCGNLIRVCDGAIYICMSPKELGQLKTAFEYAGGHWHDYVIWVKDHFTLGGGDYQHQYEPILYGWAERVSNKYKTPERDESDVWEDISTVKADFDGTHTRIKIQGFEVVIEGKVQGKIKRKKAQSNIWRFNKPSASPEHPTMKPTLLCAEAIKNNSTLEDVVLDLFGGSGSTLIAAEETGRTCYMMELDPQYVDVIRKRFAKLHDHEDDWDSYTPAIQTQPEISDEAPSPTV
jgi:DNA modification methylase